jgi:hypothetical protein
MSGALPTQVLKAWCLVKQMGNSLSLSLSLSLAPQPRLGLGLLCNLLPLKMAEFLGGFSTIFFSRG